jgi:predicted AAA+ superfamily ATPase
MLFPGKPYFNMEARDTRDFATDDPRGFLAQVQGGAILDEIQRVPDLASYLQEEVDRDARHGRFILTGSENFALSATVSQSLAGRTGILHLLPLTRDEVTAFPEAPGDLWPAVWSGGYPRVFDQRIPPAVWFADYLATYIERDVRRLLNIGDLRSFATFMQLAAGRTGQELNLSSLGADVGVAVNTIKAWISVLETSYLVTLIPAWHANTRKRAVKAPKLHFLDSGLVCHLLGIGDAGQLALHPLRGAIFESWMVAEIVKARLNQGLAIDCFHYREPRGPEVDLMVRGAGGWLLVEAKSSQTLNSEFFQHLLGLGHELGDAVAGLRLVHGGENASNRSGVEVWPWRKIQGAVWT